jgi:hypothetical protein
MRPMLSRIAALLTCLSLMSCSHMRDTKTVANPEATHIWAFQNEGGDDLVLYCDSGWPSAGRPLCVRYPERMQLPAPPAMAISAPAVTVPSVVVTSPSRPVAHPASMDLSGVPASQR